MPYTTAGDRQIYYELHGSGPALLLIHGSGGHHMAWWRQVSDLSASHTVITLDLRGFGNSGAVADGPDCLDFVADVEAVLDATDVEKCVLLGQSIGANAALRVGVRRPGQVPAVILVQSLGGINDPELGQMAAENRKEAEALPILSRLLTPEYQASHPAETFLFRQLSTFNHATMRDIRNVPVKGPTIEEVAATGLQVCLLCGGRDPAMRPETVKRAHEKIPGSHLKLIEAGPHSMYWEVPDLFNGAVAELLGAIYG